MATFLGTHITKFDSTPPATVNARQHGGLVKYIGDTFELADTANADFAIVAKLPIDSMLVSLKAAFDDLGSAGTVDIGFYKKNADGTYTVVDADAIANNLDVNTAAVALTEYRFSAKGIETMNQNVWELAGLSARPAYTDMYVGLTTDTGTTAAATATVQILYTE